MSHLLLPHPIFLCEGQNTPHPALVAQVLHSWSILTKQSHPVGNGETVVFPEGFTPQSSDSPVHDKLSISPQFSSGKCFPNAGQVSQGCPRAVEPWAGNPPSSQKKGM